MNLCKYKYIFGYPNQGIHRFRLFNIAIVDVIQTFIGSLVLSYLFKTPLLWTTISLFIFAEIIHYIFCIDTAVMVFLFPDTFRPTNS